MLLIVILTYHKFMIVRVIYLSFLLKNQDSKFMVKNTIFILFKTIGDSRYSLLNQESLIPFVS